VLTEVIDNHRGRPLLLALT